MNIFKATVNDAQNILSIQKAAYQSEAELYNDFSIPPLHQTLQELEKEISTIVFLKALVNSNIVGAVRGFVENGNCYIGRLIVLPEYQGRGIGGHLLCELENNFPQANRFELFTGSRSSKNLHLYQKHGYKEFKQETLSDNVILVYLEKFSRERLNKSSSERKLY